MASRRKRSAEAPKWEPTKRWLRDISVAATIALARTKVDAEGCLLWTGATGGPADRRRPQMRFNGKMVYVSRVVLSRKLGRPLKHRMLAVHSCDKGLCIHPKCLSEGTHSRNNQEAWDRIKRPKLLSEDQPL